MASVSVPAPVMSLALTGADDHCLVLPFDRRASEVPTFLRLIAQTGHFKLFRAEKS